MNLEKLDHYLEMYRCICNKGFTFCGNSNDYFVCNFTINLMQHAVTLVYQNLTGLKCERPVVSERVEKTKLINGIRESISRKDSS